MRVLSVRQPWADAIIFGGKDVENRPRSLGPYTGLVAIHASGTKDTGWRRHPQADMVGRFLKAHPKHAGARHLGAIIGVVNLTGSHHASTCLTPHPECATCGCQPPCQYATTCSPWGQQGTHHLRLTEARALEHPIAHKGGLGLLNAAPELERIILEQLNTQTPVPTGVTP